MDIEEGEEIVTDGTFSVDAAAQLEGKPSMMNRFRREFRRKRGMSLTHFAANPAKKIVVQ